MLAAAACVHPCLQEGQTLCSGCKACGNPRQQLAVGLAIEERVQAACCLGSHNGQQVGRGLHTAGTRFHKPACTVLLLLAAAHPTDEPHREHTTVLNQLVESPTGLLQSAHRAWRDNTSANVPLDIFWEVQQRKDWRGIVGVTNRSRLPLACCRRHYKAANSSA